MANPEDCYINALNEYEGQWDNMTDATKAFINTLLPQFYEKTGIKVTLSSGWRDLAHSPNGPSHHMEGTAFDVSGDELNPVEMRDLYGQMAKDLGGTPLDEYYDQQDSQWMTRGYNTTGANFHVTVTDQSGSYSGGGGGANEVGKKVQAFIDWCVKTANEEPHHYVWGAAGPTDFDCTGFLSYGMQQAGFAMEPCHGDAFDSGVIAAGWESIDYDDSMGYDKLQPGDILNNPHHVELYVGNGQVCGAHSANKPDADQISVEGWFPDGWTNIYRATGAAGMKGPGGGPKGPGGGPGSSNAYMNNIKDLGGSVELLPSKKTYCEPMYPDYLYVAGNIPCSAVEATAVNSSGQMDSTSDYAIMTGQTMQDLMGLNNEAFTTPDAMALAQRAFDPSKAELEVKVPNAGKPLNNNDSFPVDLKIEELERHLPRVKQYKMPYNKKCGVSKNVSAAILHISDWAEKRIVRLENILATTMRYVYGMGSRMFVNCQYYGGQDHRSKYKCIRCLKDDRTDDGQVMTIDQCLSCSRYEPIIGQTYDILNEVGANLANIEDDMQAGYMNMQDTLDFMRVEKMHQKKKAYKLNYQFTQTQNLNEYKFKDIWDDGVKMDWKLTPVEQQKPQINWRADVNSEDKSPAKLDSYQSGPGQTGEDQNPSLKSGEAGDWVSKHLQKMNELLEIKKKHDEKAKDSNTGSCGSDDSADSEYEKNQHAIEAVENGFAAAGTCDVDKAVDNMKNMGYEQGLQNACTEAKADPILVFTLATMKTGGDSSAEKGLFGMDGVDNTMSISDQAKKQIEALDAGGKKKGSNPIGMIQSLYGWNDDLEKLNSDSTEFTEEWVVAAGDQALMFPEFVKLYDAIKSKNTGLSQASTEMNGGTNGADFPLATADLTNAYLVQDYGVASIAENVATVSNGVIIKLPANTDIHAPCDGTFSEMAYDEQIGNFTKLSDSSCGLTFTYGGLDYMDKTSVKKGEVFGHSTERLVLRVEDQHGYTDPKGTWNKISNKLSNEKSIGKLIEEENQKTTSMS